jgi:hypothetical protein
MDAGRGRGNLAVGTNRRYADSIDRQMNERVMQTVSRNAKLQTLSGQELRLDEVPLTIDPKPRRKVRAWVRFGDVPLQVEAVAARWTADAVGIEFTIADTAHRCWVWSGAVEEIP